MASTSGNDLVSCGNETCGARVMRRIAVHSIGNRLFCGRNCLNAVSQSIPFERTIRIPANETPMNGSRIVRLH